MTSSQKIQPVASASSPVVQLWMLDGSFHSAGTIKLKDAHWERPFPWESCSSRLIQSKSVLTCCCHVPATGAWVLPGHLVPKQRHCSACASTDTLPLKERPWLWQSQVHHCPETLLWKATKAQRGCCPGQAALKPSCTADSAAKPGAQCLQGEETPWAAQPHWCTAVPLYTQSWLWLGGLQWAGADDVPDPVMLQEVPRLHYSALDPRMLHEVWEGYFPAWEAAHKCLPWAPGKAPQAEAEVLP